VKLAQKFVPVLVDGDEDKSIGTEYGARGYPTTVFTDAKGKEIGRVGGYVPTPDFLSGLKNALKKAGNAPLKKAAKDLEEASAALAKAREKSDWKATLKAAGTILKINHEGAALEAARKAKEEAAAEAAKRLEAAKGMKAEGKVPEARATLSKIASEFEGTDPASEAKAILKELDAMPPEGGGK